MNKLLFTFFVLGIGLPGFSQSSAIDELKHRLPGAAIGIHVIRLSTHETVMEHLSDVAFTPASTTKLISTTLAYEKKGIGYTFNTPILYSGNIRNGILYGNIIINAQGDPCFNSKYFPNHNLNRLILNELRKQGISHIMGRIVIENNVYDECLSIPGSWTWEDLGNYYGAAYHLFNYHDNSFTLTYSTQGTGSQAVIKAIDPAVPNVDIISNVTAAVGGDKAYIYGNPLCQRLQISGTIPPNKKSFKVRGTLFNPAEAFILALIGTLKGQNITIGNEKYNSYPTTLLCNAQSPTVEEIAYQTNKISVNLFAEALGQSAVEDFPTHVNRELHNIHIDTVGVRLFDACGLSPFNAIPPHTFTQLLRYAHYEFGSTFTNTLPAAGMDYGLAPYISNPVLIGKLKAKTGSFTGVRCLCGYLTTNQGETLAFSVMVNHYTCSSADASKAIGQFLERLLEL